MVCVSSFPSRINGFALLWLFVLFRDRVGESLLALLFRRGSTRRLKVLHGGILCEPLAHPDKRTNNVIGPLRVR